MASITNNSSGVTYYQEPESEASIPGFAGDTSDIKAYIDYARESAQYQNEWNSAQARKQMDFQKMMSDTAHQREVQDLKAAGLNPVLSAGGHGAQSAQGASARASDPMSSISGIVGAITSAQASIENARVSAASNMAIAQLQAESAQKIAESQISHDRWKTENYSTNVWSMISQFLNGSGNSPKQLGELYNYYVGPNFIDKIVDFVGGIFGSSKGPSSKSGSSARGYSHKSGQF